MQVMIDCSNMNFIDCEAFFYISYYFFKILLKFKPFCCSPLFRLEQIGYAVAFRICGLREKLSADINSSLCAPNTTFYFNFQ